MSSELIDLNDLDLLADSGDESKDKTDIVDYKMVTFSLGGKDYGIDIMKVKEISKASKFTYVPNSIPFVKGVYNLRGDIISVIDLRLMFHLPVPENTTGIENMIILRLEENTIGVIVDTIDKVVGINSEKIQPPHPLFGDINIKFIKGIVENEEKLYIILDVESIFDQKAAENALAQKSYGTGSLASTSDTATGQPVVKQSSKDGNNVDYNFIVETLATFSHFFVSPINEGWVKNRFNSWSNQRASGGLSVQFNSAAEANEFLTGFASPNSGRFWEADYSAALSEILPDNESGTYNAWDVGCGKGEEAYSIAVCLKKKFGSKKIRIYANDSDLLNISTAPNLIFTKNSVPEMYDEWVTEGNNGWHFTSEIKDLILFEYHDVTNDNQFAPVDLIIARDILSYLTATDQQKLIEIFYEKLKPGGILIAGSNEVISGSGWEPFNKGRVPAYKKI
ncbi:MAG: chemotaxis protein CheW [Spirochaetales bacterium]|uniref:Chemotaxis protein CheW n=1 Tax=Candidatus Thalassospirochaeta sargassi TaxID=3119039 RepID=A0AAJ1MIM2_9SPIO|nr:chemotaxis protein CheW [Spirochaetales bacterium]